TSSDELGLFALEPSTLATTRLGDATYWSTQAIRVVEGDIVLERWTGDFYELIRLDPTTLEEEIVLSGEADAYRAFHDAAAEGVLVTRGESWAEELWIVSWTGEAERRVASDGRFAAAFFLDR